MKKIFITLATIAVCFSAESFAMNAKTLSDLKLLNQNEYALKTGSPQCEQTFGLFSSIKLKNEALFFGASPIAFQINGKRADDAISAFSNFKKCVSQKLATTALNAVNVKQQFVCDGKVVSTDTLALQIISNTEVVLSSSRNGQQISCDYFLESILK